MFLQHDGEVIWATEIAFHWDAELVRWVYQWVGLEVDRFFYNHCSQTCSQKGGGGGGGGVGGKLKLGGGEKEKI